MTGQAPRAEDGGPGHGPTSFERGQALSPAPFGPIAHSAWVPGPARRVTMAYVLLALLPMTTSGTAVNRLNRYSIHGLIIDRPGIHLAVILEALGLPIGVVTHHLDALERENFIRSVADGKLRRYYSTDTRPPGDAAMALEHVREALLALVRARPGISQKEIIREMGVDRESVVLGLLDLVRQGALNRSRAGRHAVYTVGKRNGSATTATAARPPWDQ